MSKTNSHTEILTVIEGEEYIFYTEGSEPLGDYIGFSEFNSIIDSACLAGEQGSSPRGHNDINSDKEEAPN